MKKNVEWGVNGYSKYRLHNKLYWHIQICLLLCIEKDSFFPTFMRNVHPSNKLKLHRKTLFFLAPLLQWTTPSDSIKLNSAAAVNSSAVWFHLTKSHLVCAVGAHCFWFCAPLIHYYSCSSACTAASTSRSCGRDHTDVCVVIFGSSGSVQFGHLQNNHWRP